MKLSGGILISTLFVLFMSAHFAWAQNDEGRPMRSVKPSSPILAVQSVNAASFPPAPNSLLTDDALGQQLTQYYIAQYSSLGGISYLNAVLERASLYLPFIKEEVKNRGLPPELAYLPVIESSFQITARSRSGAVGLWQFMLNSISPFNIRVNDYVDERRDIIKSTKGALQKLEDNYRTLGSWELALAAYNGGLGAVSRAVQKAKTGDYWELCKKNDLKNETIHYVPKFLAAAFILSQPRRFGIDNWQKNYEWIAIPLKRQISLEILASEAGINREILRRLNAELLGGISPLDSNYMLKVPAEYLESVNAVLQREDLKLIRYNYHVVRHGDTLWSLTRHYGVSLELVEQHNPGVNSRHLRLGETLIIPALNDVKPPVRPVLTHRLEGTHTVTKGETLWSLGIKYGIDPQTLAEENGMNLNQILREGKTLKVPIIE